MTQPDYDLLIIGGGLVGASLAGALDGLDLRIGLVEQLADSPDAMIADILAASPHSIRETKGFIRRVLGGQAEDDAETLAAFAAAFEGADFLEGTSAFVEKRKPRFGQ